MAPSASALLDLDEPPFFERHRGLRWGVPALFVAALVAGAALALWPDPDQQLPGRSPAALLAAARAPLTQGFTGTVVSRLSPGLAALPPYGATGAPGAEQPAELSGAHTVEVWYGAPDRQRVAVLDTRGETDVFRDGTDEWEWRSAGRSAVHSTVPVGGSDAVPLARDLLALTPAALTSSALAAVDDDTQVSVLPEHTVADRDAYELVLTPHDPHTKVDSVHVSLDGATLVPLGVQIYGHGARTASLDVAFTAIHFHRPPDASFRFTPPSGAHVRDERPGVGAAMAATSAPERSTPDPVAVLASGRGWSAVLAYSARTPAALPAVPVPGVGAGYPVSGSWGRGRVYESDLITVLVTSSGRVYVGPVDAASVFAAANR